VSRKDLSRSVIEGGRYYHNCWMRRTSHRTARARTREWLDEVRRDRDAADASSPRPPRRVHRMFHDKLAPARRWLAAQVGRPWAKVFADLCARFDTRTIAGRHIVNDHMLGWVWTGAEDVPEYRRNDFMIDRQGILRDSTWRERRDEVMRWSHGVAAKTYWGWWWFAERVTRDPATRAVTDRWHEPIRRLTRAEIRRVERLPNDLRGYVVLHWKALMLR